MSQWVKKKTATQLDIKRKTHTDLLQEWQGEWVYTLMAGGQHTLITNVKVRRRENMVSFISG